MTDEKKNGLWKLFKKPLIEVEVDSSKETKKKEKEESVVMSFNSNQSSYGSDASAIISASMVITGDVDLETNLICAGKIIGNINCKGTIETKVGGSIVGNISAQSAEIVGGNTKGNISVEEKIVVDIESSIEGDIKAKDVVISGKVVGEIKAENTVRLTASANIQGDLYATSINIEAGAKLNGKFVVQP